MWKSEISMFYTLVCKKKNYFPFLPAKKEIRNFWAAKLVFSLSVDHYKPQDILLFRSK